MKLFLEKIKKFHHDDRGDIVQQGILYAFGAIIAVGAMVYLLPKIRNLFNRTGQELDQSSSTSY